MPRVVRPQEAGVAVEFDRSLWPDSLDLLHTVATEPERIRAAVVKALREMAALRRGAIFGVEHVPAGWITERADAIENGAPLA